MTALVPEAVRPGRLTLLHARYLLLETLRTPIAVVGTTVFPALSLLFFVAPQGAVADDPVQATAAASQLALFAVMSVCLFQYGVGVAEDRALPWDGYLRTLPVGAGPRLGGRAAVGLVMSLIGLAPLAVLAASLTAATLSPPRLLLGAVALLAAALPLLGLGVAIGYRFTVKAALPIANVLLLPLAFAGGLFIPPQVFPGWLDALSRLLPTRAGRDLVVAATTGAPLAASAVVVLAGWSLALGALAVTAYRRDEGRRYR